MALCLIIVCHKFWLQHDALCIDVGCPHGTRWGYSNSFALGTDVPEGIQLGDGSVEYGKGGQEDLQEVDLDDFEGFDDGALGKFG